MGKGKFDQLFSGESLCGIDEDLDVKGKNGIDPERVIFRLRPRASALSLSG